jgi:hypothetical protein
MSSDLGITIRDGEHAKMNLQGFPIRAGVMGDHTLRVERKICFIMSLSGDEIIVATLQRAVLITWLGWRPFMNSSN